MNQAASPPETTGRAAGCSCSPLPRRRAAEATARGSSPSIVLVAGEASGDWAGALLGEALRRRRPDVRLCGVGGRRMAAAGFEMLADSSDWGVIGALDAARKIPRVWSALRRLTRRVEEERPSALVLIDSGGVNIPLLRMTRKLGLKRLYYLPPGSWSRRPRGHGLRELVDVIATPFPWSRDLLAGGAARVEWVGHPVVESARPSMSAEEAWRRYGLDPARPVIALAPGSREQEIRYLLPLLAASARLISSQSPGVQFLVPASDPARGGGIRDAFNRAGVRAVVLDGMEYGALQLAQAAAVCSGTATLEFACLGIPMVIVYQASPGTALQYVLFRGLIGRQWRIGLPNIIAGRDIVPELLWRYAWPEAVAREISSLLTDTRRRDQMMADLADVKAQLGEGNASDRTAELVLEMIEAGCELEGART